MAIQCRNAELADRDEVTHLMVTTFLARDSEWLKWTHDADHYEDRLRKGFDLTFDFVVEFGEIFVSCDNDEIVSASMWLESWTDVPVAGELVRQEKLRDIQGSRYDVSKTAGMNLVAIGRRHQFMSTWHWQQPGPIISEEAWRARRSRKYLRDAINRDMPFI